MIPSTLFETNFQFPGQTRVHKGKVRDVYKTSDMLILVVTDRISAFDVILPHPIPYKGQVLNQIAASMLEATRDIVPNWLLGVPDPNVSVGMLCEPLKVEMVIRGYLTGHAWREYQAGKRMLCGIPLPEGMKENEAFPEPIITPSTKADVGHDEDISREDIIVRKIVSEHDYERMEHYTRLLFKRGSELAAKQGLILVDTKYEFGKKDDSVMLIDEIHTPDSSRYFYKDSYDENLSKGLPQRQLSKEFVRQWLIENGFQGKEGQQVPSMSQEWIMEISSRYVELYETLTGKAFQYPKEENILERVQRNLLLFLQSAARVKQD